MKHVLLIVSLFLVGCVPNASNMQYASTDLAGAAPTVEGVVVSKRPIQVAGTEGGSAVGTVVGGLAGAVIGSGFGGGRGNSLATLGGAVAGGLVGDQIGKAVTKQNAFEYIVRLEQTQKVKEVTGRTRSYTERNISAKRLVTIIQSDAGFQVGNRVFVVMSSKPVIVGSAN